MNFPKINMFLLIVVIVLLAAALYFLFINKKETNGQSELLLQMAKKIGAENSKLQDSNKETSAEEPAAPTEQEWNGIYKISEKLYFERSLTKEEKILYKKFEKQVAADFEFCSHFYPVVEKIMKDEELTGADKEFYESNKDVVDEEVTFQKKQKEKPGAGMTSTINDQPSAIKGASPPLAIEERNNLIFSFFEDDAPKSVSRLKELYKEKTGKDMKKNMYRVLEPMVKGKLLLEFKYNKLTYLAPPAWFDGKKLKTEYKIKIIA